MGWDFAGLLVRGNGDKIGWDKDGWLRVSCQAPCAPQGVGESRAELWSGFCWHLAHCKHHPGKHEMPFTKPEMKSKSSQHSLQVSQKMVQQELTILPSLLSTVNTKCCTELHRAHLIWADRSEHFPTIPFFFFLELTLKKTIPNSELATKFNHTYFVHFQKRRTTKIAILKWKIVWAVLAFGSKSRQI